MKFTLSLFLALFINSHYLIAAEVNNGDIEQRTQASKAVIKQFFEELKSELKGALTAGGPAKAIEVCKQVAPAIALKYSTQNNWSVSRTSLKNRNPDNAPDAWEKSVLEKFNARKAAGEDPLTIDYAEIVDNKGERNFRYMKAIPTAEKPCLMCHGTKIKPEINELLNKHYPEDKAVGYQEGDIRGAFSITQPM
ncbi:MAG: DUF3365 domain-containing protein [Gammaproteobacteria bacterium]|nr:DUF3365 domain-containing protein [Gammaproteobacteria bacterium]